jgi:hypothetical protein
MLNTLHLYERMVDVIILQAKQVAKENMVDKRIFFSSRPNDSRHFDVVTWKNLIYLTGDLSQNNIILNLGFFKFEIQDEGFADDIRNHADLNLEATSFEMKEMNEKLESVSLGFRFESGIKSYTFNLKEIKRTMKWDYSSMVADKSVEITSSVSSGISIFKIHHYYYSCSEHSLVEKVRSYKNRNDELIVENANADSHERLNFSEASGKTKITSSDTIIHKIYLSFQGDRINYIFDKMDSSM